MRRKVPSASTSQRILSEMRCTVRTRLKRLRWKSHSFSVSPNCFSFNWWQCLALVSTIKILVLRSIKFPMMYSNLSRRLVVAGWILAASSSVAQNSALHLSTASLAFSAIANGPNPPTQAIIVTSVSGTATDFALLVDSGAPGTPVPAWLSVTPLLATTPAQIRVTVNPTALAPGAYSGRIQLTDRKGISLGIIIPVTLQTTTGTPQFDVTPSEVIFSDSVSAGNVQQGVLLRSLGPG